MGIAILQGWGVGASSKSYFTAGTEAKQGKNYYLNAAYQTLQLYIFSDLTGKLGDIFPNPTVRVALKTISATGPLLALSAFLLYSGAEKQDGLPTKFTPPPLLQKVTRLTAEHAGNCMNIAMIVSAVALIALGNSFYGAALLSALTLYTLDAHQFLPSKVSQLMAKHLPLIELIGMCLSSLGLLRALAIFELPRYVAPSLVNLTLQHKVDLLFKQCYGIFGFYSPPLVELEAPLTLKKNLSFEEITQILDAPESEFQLNLAHCSKNLVDFSKLEKNDRFSTFLDLFNTIEWEKKYGLIKPKLADDRRFIDHLRCKFPDESKESLKKNIDLFISKLAKENKESKEQYAAKYIKKELTTLITKLEGRAKTEGARQELARAIENYKYILPHLISLKDSQKQQDKVEFENSLLELAIEAGDYCNLAILRVSKDLLNSIVAKKNIPDIYDFADFEKELMIALQTMRHQIAQGAYHKLANPLGSGFESEIHIADMHMNTFSLGFNPISEPERTSLMNTSLLFLNYPPYFIHRQEMIQDYQRRLFEAFKEIGEFKSMEHILRLIETHPKLTSEQRNKLKSRYTKVTGDAKFKRLVLVMLGVLKLKEPK